jgi:hypothetical protein
MIYTHPRVIINSALCQIEYDLAQIIARGENHEPPYNIYLALDRALDAFIEIDTRDGEEEDNQDFRRLLTILDYLAKDNDQTSGFFTILRKTSPILLKIDQLFDFDTVTLTDNTKFVIYKALGKQIESIRIVA